jgi:folate-dependent phosphoribosylglycinamide formyltransferase PurN
MNIHPALLPSFGGQGMWGHHVHEAVLAAGCKISGCTVHFCTNEYDKGPIIVQKSCPAYDSDSADELAARVFEQECLAYPEAIDLFEKGKLCVEGSVVRIKE